MASCRERGGLRNQAACAPSAHQLPWHGSTAQGMEQQAWQRRRRRPPGCVTQQPSGCRAGRTRRRVSSISRVARLPANAQLWQHWEQLSMPLEFRVHCCWRYRCHHVYLMCLPGNRLQHQLQQNTQAWCARRQARPWVEQSLNPRRWKEQNPTRGERTGGGNNVESQGGEAATHQTGRSGKRRWGWRGRAHGWASTRGRP